jgi:hypothetical protein
MMIPMRVRAVLSIVVLIAIAIVAPIVMHARGRDQAADVFSVDNDPDVPATFDTGHAANVTFVQSYVIVDSAERCSVRVTRRTPVLVTAPKTSPPLV